MLPGLEEINGIKPYPKTRDATSKYIHIELSREIRRRLSNELLNVDGRRRKWEHGLMTADEVRAEMGLPPIQGVVYTLDENLMYLWEHDFEQGMEFEFLNAESERLSGE